MTWPSVDINQLNQYQGTSTEIERVVLFVGIGATNAGTLQPLNSNTNLDTVLGAADSVLKSNIAAARRNAGNNWFAYVAILAADAKTADWVAAVKSAQQTASVEGFVLCMDIADKADINAAITLRADLIAQNSRWLWAILSVGGPDEAKSETWAQYGARLATLQKDIAGPSVQLVPRLWGNEPGVLAGRLCNRSVTIADSPARVRTGALIDLGRDELPTDGADVPLDLSVLQALNANRYSVPMWYVDYAGLYWSDGRTLEVDGGDYSVIEYLRTVDKAARRVRLLAIPKIADRSLNSSDSSIAAHETYFSKPMREMAISSQINGVTFPGEVKPPKDGDVTITWLNSTKVQIFMTARPYASPKEISIGILLDTSLTE
ncbi:DUF2586 family protein [Serratia marcescens]|uniref:DUF2586 domain-containing protein n=1 Tax=Serratia marcescens TaxID=615 RepID=UPI002FC4C1A8|nr:DUF2586 family protein [Serratia marcescens]